MTSHYQYPYDPTGKSPDNVVSDEPHPLAPVQGKGYSLIVPKAAPFFREDFKLVHTASGKILTPDVDYVFTHFVMDLSHGLQKHIYGSVTVVNQQYMGNVTPTYQTLGGALVLHEDNFAKYAIHLLESDGAYPWDKLTDVPSEFPPSEHEVPLETTAGYDELISAIKQISLGGDHMHDIHNIRHLDDRLSNKLDSNGSYKILTSANFHIQNSFIGTVQCRLPKVKSECLIKAKVQIADAQGIKTIEVSGTVKPYNDGVIPLQWGGLVISSSYDCWDGNIFMSYDSEHYPTIFLGVDHEWVNAHVSVIEYFTVDPREIEGEYNPFRVSINNSLSGMNFINTSDEGHILIPATTESEVTNVINRRYFGVMPEGIYTGFNIVQTAEDQIRIGDPNMRNAAVAYDSLEAATIILDKTAQILTVSGPQYSTIVIELVPVGQVGDPRMKVDLPDREAQIRLISRSQLKEGMVIIGEINWPAEDPFLTIDHLSYSNRMNAIWNAGTFAPIVSEVVFEPPQ